MVIRVKTSRCKEEWFPLIWKFAHAQCLHCAVQCHYSFFFFFPFMPDSWYSFKTCLWSAQQGTKESFEKTVTWEKRTDFFFLFNIAWTLPAYAHAQNCPSRLTMYHLFSLDRSWFTDWIFKKYIKLPPSFENIQAQYKPYCIHRFKIFLPERLA